MAIYFCKSLKEGYLYKKITAFVFIVAFILQTFSSIWLVADYYTDTGKYLKSCINKTRPAIRCNGRCQLMKKIKEAKSKDQQCPDRKLENKYEQALSYTSFVAIIPLPGVILIDLYKDLCFAFRVEKGCLFSVFHPPQIA